MDEVFFYFVVGASLIVLAGIWIKLLIDNSVQEKLIEKYNADLRVVRRENSRKLFKRPNYIPTDLVHRFTKENQVA